MGWKRSCLIESKDIRNILVLRVSGWNGTQDLGVSLFGAKKSNENKGTSSLYSFKMVEGKCNIYNKNGTKFSEVFKNVPRGNE